MQYQLKQEKDDAIFQKMLGYDDRQFELHKKFLILRHKVDLHCPIKTASQLHEQCMVWWDEATEEQKNDPSLEWTSTGLGPTLKHGKDKYAYRPLTEQEKKKEELYYKRLYYIMYNTLLTEDGWQIAEAFTKHPYYVKDFEKYGVTFNEKHPHCRFDADNQCDLSCPYFIKKCTYFDTSEENYGSNSRKY